MNFFIPKLMKIRVWMESSEIDENLLKWMKNGQIG
jgi:hypothetical protein